MRWNKKKNTKKLLITVLIISFDIGINFLAEISIMLIYWFGKMDIKNSLHDFYSQTTELVIANLDYWMSSVETMPEFPQTGIIYRYTYMYFILSDTTFKPSFFF